MTHAPGDSGCGTGPLGDLDAALLEHGLTSGTLPDGLLDSVSTALRRLRRTMVKPPSSLVPVPSLGRRLDLSKVMACAALADLREAKARDGEPAAVTVKDVAAALELEHSTVSRLLGELEADGLVLRSEDPTDRRRTAVALTERGQAVVSDARLMNRQFLRILLAEWSGADVAQLGAVMTRLAGTAADRLPRLQDLLRERLAPLDGDELTGEVDPGR